MLHSCLPFPNFFSQVMHFNKLDYVVLTNTYFKPLQTFSLAEAYYQAVENAWPKQLSQKLSTELEISQLITYF
jgi:hypothetical protein